jgi:hypothetical protein
LVFVVIVKLPLIGVSPIPTFFSYKFILDGCDNYLNKRNASPSFKKLTPLPPMTLPPAPPLGGRGEKIEECLVRIIPPLLFFKRGG